MPVLIMFRSLTYAQRGSRVLDRAGISAAVTKAPMLTTDNGCSYCIRIPEAQIRNALIELENSAIGYGRILRIQSDGSYKEMFL